VSPSWEIISTTKWDTAEELAAEGWEPYAVTHAATHVVDERGDSYSDQHWYYFRRRKEESGV
jgi:hypothetical protein